MAAKRKLIVGVIFGGRSVEHDVSVVTGQQVMRAFDPERTNVVPIYIDRDGRWFTGDPLRDLKNFENALSSQAGIVPCALSPSIQHHGLIVNPMPSGLFAKSTIQRLDVVFPALHGSHGEDGTVQGVLELADIPYVGCGVLASAVANDKWLCKVVLRGHGIPVADGQLIDRHDWDTDADAVIARLEAVLPYPVFVKPATLGSSIGIARADDAARLRSAIEMAINLDRRILIEAAVQNAVEINCAVIGDERAVTTSVLEQPVSYEEFLTFEEKYVRGGGEGMKNAERIIPAPLSPTLTAEVQRIAHAAFRAIDGRGTARIDFLVRPLTSEVILNEINTLPGSLAFYLWQEDGLGPRQTVDKLVTLARDINATKRRSTFNYRTNLIGLTAQRGLQGAKGSKRVRSPQS